MCAFSQNMCGALQCAKMVLGATEDSQGTEHGDLCSPKAGRRVRKGEERGSHQTRTSREVPKPQSSAPVYTGLNYLVPTEGSWAGIGILILQMRKLRLER